MSSSSNSDENRENVREGAAEGASNVSLSEAELEVLHDRSDEAPIEGVENFDLSRPRVLRPAQQEGLETLFETATKLITPVLKHELHTEVIVNFKSGEAIYFDTFIGNLVQPMNVFPVTYRGHEFQGALSLDLSMAYWFVNSLLGGEEAEAENRSLTDTESAVATKIVELILDEIHTSLAPTVQIDAKIDGFVASRTQAHVMKPPSIAYACRFVVQWASTQAEFVYVMPLKLLRPIIATLEPKSDGQRERRLEALFGTLGQAFLSVELRVAGVVGRPTLSLSDLTNLSVGDVIPLGGSLDEVIDVTVQGQPKLTGAFGLQRGKYAIVVNNWIREP